MIIWGLREGYCHYCNDFVDTEVIYQSGTDSGGAPISFACCLQCAVDRGIIDV